MYRLKRGISFNACNLSDVTSNDGFDGLVFNPLTNH